MTKLKNQIDLFNQQLQTQLSKDTLEAFGRSIKDLKDKGIEEKCIAVGEILPPFRLPNSEGNLVASDDLLSENNKLIIAFFRGSWCPYCSLELKAIQDELSKIESRKAVIVAISPQANSFSEKLKTENGLQFDLLHDNNNEYARQLGIVFQFQDFMKPYYKQMNIDLYEYNHMEDDTLPIPAVFVVDKTGLITYSFVDSNYMNRVNIEELLKAL